jgi:hypothetical protein
MQPDLTQHQARFFPICPNGPTKILGIRMLYEKPSKKNL